MIISKEESQDQVQVYIEEIIQENPAPSLETGLRTSCEGLTGSDCTAKKYCDLQCDSCLLSCSLFKRGRCDDTDYCKWTVDNICKCSGVVEEVCNNNNICESGESCSNCPQDCYNQQDGCSQGMICSSRSGSQPYSCLGIAGSSCTSNDNCAYGLKCSTTPTGLKCKQPTT